MRLLVYCNKKYWIIVQDAPKPCCNFIVHRQRGPSRYLTTCKDPPTSFFHDRTNDFPHYEWTMRSKSVPGLRCRGHHPSSPPPPSSILEPNSHSKWSSNLSKNGTSNNLRDDIFTSILNYISYFWSSFNFSHLPNSLNFSLIVMYIY